MDDPIEKASKDRGAIWVFVGFDIFFLGLFYALVPISGLRDAESFFAPVILIVLNKFLADYLFHRSDRLRETIMLGNSIAFVLGFVTGFLHFLLLSTNPQGDFIAKGVVTVLWVPLTLLYVALYIRHLKKVAIEEISI